MKKRIITMMFTGFVALMLAGVLSACDGDDSGESVSPTEAPVQEEAGLGDTELEWNGYTLGIDLVTENEKMVTVGNVQVDGRLVKVCFYYIDDAINSGGLPGETILTDLQEHPMTLVDVDGTVYEWTGAVGDISFTGNDLSAEDFGIAAIQERISVTFDVPENIALEDLTLEVGDGQKIKLSEYISEAYQADLND